MRCAVVWIMSLSVLVVGLISLIYSVGTANDSNASTGTNAGANCMLLASYIFVSPTRRQPPPPPSLGPHRDTPSSNVLWRRIMLRCGVMCDVLRCLYLFL
jgi:hypothetical protein